MPAIRLVAMRIEKPWGRRDLGPFFDPVPANAPAVGEIRFEVPGSKSPEPELLIKYLFTDQPLSVQVHPDDAAARARGLARGKDEAWVVLEACPDAVIGLGLRVAVDAATLRAAALDGSIERLIAWRPASAGMALYSLAGTIHAIGAGLTIVEIQQNLDLTYRLHDYGSDRPLHLDDAIAVARPTPGPAASVPIDIASGRQLLVAGPAFVVERWRGHGRFRLATGGQATWLVPLTGATIDGMTMRPGEAWLTDVPSVVDCAAGSDLLVAYEGAVVRAEAISADRRNGTASTESAR